MTATEIRAENIVYGIAVRAGRDSGWKIVGSSVVPLPAAVEEAIVTRTHVGLNRDQETGGGVGYFGEIPFEGGRRAVICRYEPTSFTEATGHHFVQRNIVLLDFDDFVSTGARALDFVRDVPRLPAFDDLATVKRISPLRLHVRPENPKPEVRPPTLERLLSALLQDGPTIITWADPDPAVLQYLLNFFPPSIRAFITWCTCVVDVAAAKSRVKIVRSVEVEPNATIFLFDRQQFAQERIDASLAPDLVAILTAAAGAGDLDSVHAAIERAVRDISDYRALLVAANRAATRWRRRKSIDSLPPAERWPRFQDHAADLRDDFSPAASDERRWILTTAMRSIDPRAHDGQNLLKLAVETDFTPDDFALAGRVVADRVSDGDVTRIAAFLGAFDALGRNADILRESFFSELPAALAPAFRNWQFVDSLAKKIGELPRQIREAAVAGWAFDRTPDWSDIRKLLEYIQLQDVKLIAKNDALLAQIKKVPAGWIAFSLIAAREKNGQPLEKLPAEVSSAPPSALIQVLNDGAGRLVEWTPMFLQRVVIHVSASDAAALRKAHERLVALFIDAMAEAGGSPQLSVEERKVIDQAIADLVTRHSSLERAFELARARREIASIETALRRNLKKTIDGIENGTMAVERLLPSDGSNPMLWWTVMAEWYARERFDPARVLETLRRGSPLLAVRGARHLLAIAMTSGPWQDRERQTLEACANVLAVRDTRVEPCQDVVLGDDTQVDVVLAALTIFRGAGGISAARNALERNLPAGAQVRSWTRQLQRVTEQMEDVRRGPLAHLSNAVQGAGPGELRSLRDAVEKLLEIIRGRVLNRDLVKALERGIRDLDDLLAQSTFNKS